MKSFTDPAGYGAAWADIYDARHGSMDPTPAVELLAKLAGNGRVLELGIGTGRVALPLRRRGIEVHGIDSSEEMVEKLRAKEGGDAIPVTVGDFADVAVEGRFSLIYAVYSTFYALLTQEAQSRCFRNVAARLDPGGAFVIEAFVPDPGRYFQSGQAVSIHRLTEAEVELDVALHDPSSQRVNSQMVTLAPGRVELRPIAIRYAWPAELDLMAERAGLRLEARYADWSGSPFDNRTHVSIYRVAAR